MKKFLMPFLSLLLIVSVAGNFYLFQQLSIQNNRLALLQQQSSDLTKSAQDLQEQIDLLKNDLSEQQAEKQRLLDEIEEQLTSGIDFTFEPTEEMEAKRKEIEEKASGSQGNSASSKVESSSSSQISSSTKANNQSSSIGDWGATKKPAGGKGKDDHSTVNGAAGTPDGNILAD